MLQFLRRLLRRDRHLMRSLASHMIDSRRVAHAWLASDKDTSCRDPFETCGTGNCVYARYLAERAETYN